MKRIVQIIAILIVGFLVSSCDKPQTVTKAELEKAKAEWQEPKVSIWYYVGSKDEYHYYLHRDLPGDKCFRVSKKELIQRNQFPLTRDQNKWKLMLWGVHARQSQTLKQKTQQRH